MSEQQTLTMDDDFDNALPNVIVALPTTVPTQSKGLI